MEVKKCHIAHHEGVGQSEAHQPSGQMVVQRVGNGGHSCNQHHTGPDILLQTHSTDLLSKDQAGGDLVILISRMAADSKIDPLLLLNPNREQQE